MYSLNQSDRVYQISGKLNSLLSNFQQDKGSYLEQLEKRIFSIEEGLEESLNQDEKKFALLSEKLSSLQSRVEELRSLREDFFKLKTEEMQDFELALNEEIGLPEAKKKETESKFLRVIEERSNSLLSDLQREMKSRKEAFQGINEYCETNLVKVKDLLKKELTEREEFSERFGNNLSARIQATRQLISAEKENRDKSEDALLSMLQDLVARIKQEIEEEKRERQGSEDTLLGLLEDTCNKLNNLTKF